VHNAWEPGDGAITVLGGVVMMLKYARAEGNREICSHERQSLHKKAAHDIMGSGRMPAAHASIVCESCACGRGIVETMW
jgi:hypothetical protein